MKIQFKTGGQFVEHLPRGSSGNTAQLEVADGATPADVMRQLKLPADENYLVSLNGEVVVISQLNLRFPGVGTGLFRYFQIFSPSACFCASHSFFDST